MLLLHKKITPFIKLRLSLLLVQSVTQHFHIIYLNSIHCILYMFTYKMRLTVNPCLFLGSFIQWHTSINCLQKVTNCLPIFSEHKCIIFNSGFHVFTYKILVGLRKVKVHGLQSTMPYFYNFLRMHKCFALKPQT